MNKKGQVTIWIIAGIIIVAIVALFIVLFRTGILPSPITPSIDKNPNSFLKECMQDKVSETVKTMEPQGGTLKPTLYKRFRFVEESATYNVSYLCYNQNDYLPCVNQQPTLVSSMEKEIKENIKDTVEECFNDLESSYKNAGYTVSVSGDAYDVKLQEGEVLVSLDRTIKMTKGDQSSVLKDFKVAIPSNIYDLSIVAVEVVNKELDCNFDRVKYNLLNSKTSVEKYLDSDNTRIYTVKEKVGQEFFRFATKGGCRHG
ncbi:Uncharacterised protein [uncultured archaeon]|nr:Uncharacterised protein [uncultured archaeon]